MCWIRAHSAPHYALACVCGAALFFCMRLCPCTRAGQVYYPTDSDADVAEKMRYDVVAQLHLLTHVRNGFEHPSWLQALRCPKLQPGLAALPWLPDIDSSGMPMPSFMSLEAARNGIATVLMAAGFHGHTAHGERGWCGLWPNCCERALQGHVH